MRPSLLAILLLPLAVSVNCAPRTLRMAERILALEANYIPTEGDEMAAALDELSGRLTAWGITIVDLPPTMQGVGRASLDARTIWLRPELSPNGRFEVLAHEAGHLLQSPGLDEPTAQLFAEMVGVGIQQFYGSKTAEDVAARYLAGHKHVFGAYRWLRRDIQYAVLALTGQVPMPTFR
jgi:hypothetical protein